VVLGGWQFLMSEVPLYPCKGVPRSQGPAPLCDAGVSLMRTRRKLRGGGGGRSIVRTHEPARARSRDGSGQGGLGPNSTPQGVGVELLVHWCFVLNPHRRSPSFVITGSSIHTACT